MLILDKARAVSLMLSLAERRPVPRHLAATGATRPAPDGAVAPWPGLTDLLAVVRERRMAAASTTAHATKWPVAA